MTMSRPFEVYNLYLCAHGQTGSDKTYTKYSKGYIPSDFRFIYFLTLTIQMSSTLIFKLICKQLLHLNIQLPYYSAIAVNQSQHNEPKLSILGESSNYEYQKSKVRKNILQKRNDPIDV